ncbi:hypothetical protein N0V93_003034 [Gnomoniopsis smithogilvyi]|uniref:Uncharacterized protein n=1 Tax=Gnomoniopsis smithogilvyi TaxID=1191159 RepID=A0A9W8YXJ9_9PEZI|nr:hypothetical protein N0V93_003034 [Gnomoniopsis smithogilvyi]
MSASSRPWIDFVDAFDTIDWKIYLQEFTRQDILNYVIDVLERDAKFRKLKSSSGAAASEFIQAVTTRSEGVFLLDALPVDLEE